MPEGYVDSRVTLEEELAKYTALRVRLGATDYTFAQALRDHRRQCLENYLAEAQDYWRERIQRLDRLAEARGISMTGEMTLGQVTAALARRERMMSARSETADITSLVNRVVPRELA